MAETNKERESFCRPTYWRSLGILPLLLLYYGYHETYHKVLLCNVHWKEAHFWMRRRQTRPGDFVPAEKKRIPRRSHRQKAAGFPLRKYSSPAVCQRAHVRRREECGITLPVKTQTTPIDWIHSLHCNCCSYKCGFVSRVECGFSL